jgi:hypothetical protein
MVQISQNNKSRTPINPCNPLNIHSSSPFKEENDTKLIDQLWFISSFTMQGHKKAATSYESQLTLENSFSL